MTQRDDWPPIVHTFEAPGISSGTGGAGGWASELLVVDGEAMTDCRSELDLRQDIYGDPGNVLLQCDLETGHGGAHRMSCKEKDGALLFQATWTDDASPIDLGDFERHP